MANPLALVFLCLTAAAGAATLEVEDPFDLLGKDRILGHLSLLADDTLEGREVGTRGGMVAAAYIRARFADLGMVPGGSGGSYYQPFGVAGGAPGPTSEVTVLTGDLEIDFPLTLEPTPFVTLPGCGSGEVEADVVFAGYGITAPEHGYDDYQGIDVAGKVVLVLRHEPREQDPASPFDGARHSEHATFRTKVKNAIAHGAAALLLVTDPANHESFSPVPRGLQILRPGPGGVPEPSSELSEQQLQLTRGLHLEDDLEALRHAEAEPTPLARGLPALHVNQLVSEALLTASDLSLLELQEEIDSTLQPRSRPLGVRVRVRVELTVTPARNVCAILPGHDPELAREYVVVGAHHDHIGLDRQGRPRNGADDNASGTATVLALAEAFARCPVPPRRSLLFLTFDAEESGLRGSYHWVSDPTVPLGQVVAMVNLDMVGRNPSQPVTVLGTGTGEGLSTLLEQLGELVEVPLRISASGPFFGSDHFPFYQRQLPVVAFTTGLHRQYHTTADDTALIDGDRLTEVARLAFVTVASLCQGPRHSFQSIDEELARARRARTPRIGIFPQVVGETESQASGVAVGKGVHVRQVVPGSPAAAAGVHAGDVILSIGGAEVGGDQRRSLWRSLRAALGRASEASGKVQLRVMREGQELELSLELPGGGG